MKAWFSFRPEDSDTSVVSHMSGKPIYQEIADQLRDVISSGELAPGDRVPSTNELSAYHSVNPTTSAKALTELFNEGLVRVPVPRRCGRYRRAPSRRNRDRDDRPHPAVRQIARAVASALKPFRAQDPVARAGRLPRHRGNLHHHPALAQGADARGIVRPGRVERPGDLARQDGVGEIGVVGNLHLGKITAT